MGSISFEGLELINQAQDMAVRLAALPEDERIELINQIKLMLHDVSP